MNILQINASARRDGANSTRVANQITARLQAANPAATLTLRDLAVTPHPLLDEAALGALFTPAANRSDEQTARVALDDALISEIQAHDTIVLGVPMYNFGVPVQLKSWIDAIARAGVTFRYTATGPEGLLTGKTVYLALARGGLYRDTPNDSQVPYLKSVLGFLGLTDVRLIYAEGLAMGPDAVAKGFAQAEDDLNAALA
jgi:FMN-dependent NADH-azoreductase